MPHQPVEESLEWKVFVLVLILEYFFSGWFAWVANVMDKGFRNSIVESKGRKEGKS